MGKLCVVPNCKTGNNTWKNQSVFRIPKDIETWKKWENAIPGIVYLRKTNVVCERHFNEEDISREWIKVDTTGRVIARVAYKYPQLKKFAVPTRFNRVLEGNSLDVASEHDVLADPTNQVTSSIHAVGSSVDISSPTSTTRMSDELSIPPVGATKSESPAVASLAPQELVETCSFMRNSGQIVGKNTNTDDVDISRYISEEWSSVIMRTDLTQHVLFTYTITKITDGEECPVAQKSVRLDEAGTLKYFVYGRHVDPQDQNLERVLKKKEMLPDVLKTFKAMNICTGLGEIGLHLVPGDDSYCDYVDKWRSKGCSLLSKKKRCGTCVMTKKNALQRMRRLQNRPKINRVGGASNPIDARKILAMRLKIRRERRQKIAAQHRVNLLTTCIEPQRAKIASMEEATLDKKCSELNISDTQKLALKEIIAAAGKQDGRGRRYTEDWVMLCMLMNIRSPGYYEFLRKNNILPLPCKRSIRSYLSLINSKCGFDEQFAKLLEKHLASKAWRLEWEEADLCNSKWLQKCGPTGMAPLSRKSRAGNSAARQCSQISRKSYPFSSLLRAHHTIIVARVRERATLGRLRKESSTVEVFRLRLRQLHQYMDAEHVHVRPDRNEGFEGKNNLSTTRT